MIVVVVASLLAVKAFDLGTHGVDLVGEVPTGFSFVAWSIVSWSQVYGLIPAALAIVIVGFAQSVAIAKAYGPEYHYVVDVNQELLAYGAANVGAGALQGFTVTGSLAKSAAAEEAGGKSPLLLIVVAGLAVATVLFLAGVFADPYGNTVRVLLATLGDIGTWQWLTVATVSIPTSLCSWPTTM